ncbi:hypothetical protein L1887_14899 [Cichorium endivia]|nr:hypothetical protein L1887_14899 [Cichorium endivia]
MIECLKYSRLSKALTASASVPISLLSAAYSTAFYNKAGEMVTFEVGSVKTKISKSRFGKLLGFTDTADMVDPESLQPVTLPRLIYQMGYKGDITQLSKFAKKGLPPHWNAFFTILFKSFSERTAGSDSAMSTTNTDSQRSPVLASGPLLFTEQLRSMAFIKSEESSQTEGKGGSSDTEKPSKRSRRLRKLVMPHHSEDDHSDDQHVTNPLEDDMDDNEEGEPIVDTFQRPPTPTPDATPKPTPPHSPKSPPHKSTPPNSPPPTSPTHTSPPRKSPTPERSTHHSPKFPDPTSEQEDEDVLIYDDQDDMADYIESPFNVHFNASECTASMTQEQFKELSAKLDKLLQTNQGPSTSDWQSQLETHNDHVKTLISENVKIMKE